MGYSEPDDISDVNKLPRSKSHKKHSSKDKSLADSSAFAALDLFRDYFEDRLGSLKRELKEDAYQMSEMLAKKLKTEKSYQFKFSGNQKQLEFNADLDYDIG
jgi:predicted helicase